MHDPALIRAVLAAGLSWLYDTVQPDGVLDQHHGTGRRIGNRHYQFVPDSRGCIVVMEIADGAREYTGLGDLINPLTHHEVDLFQQALADLGRAPIDRWNGAGTETVSVRLSDPAHPSLLAAVDRYRRGCPTHDSVFCSQQFGCDWFRRHRSGLIHPVWPMPQASTGEAVPA